MAIAPNPQLLLTRDNYRSWTKQITEILETEGLVVWIKKANWPNEKDLTALDKFKLLQSRQKCAGILKTYCSPEIKISISHLEDPSEIFNTLKSLLEIPGRSLKSYCLSEFRNLKLNPEEELPSFIARFEDSYRRVEDSGESVNEKQQCYQLIQNLPEDYDYLVREFDSLADDKFNFSYIKNEILREYTRRELRERTKQETFVSDKSNEKFKPRFETKLKCNLCGREGHLAKFCRKNKERFVKTNVDSFITEFVVNNDCYVNEMLPPNWEWTLDSASTSHVCQNKSFFTTLRDPPQGAFVRMGTTPHAVRGIGNVSFNIFDQGKISTVNLHSVLYVPSIHRNLISMGKMDKAGLHAKMDHGFKIFSPKWRYLYTATLKGNFYTLKALRQDKKVEVKEINKNIPNVKNKFNSNLYNSTYAIERDNIMLWHERLGHCNINVIKKMFGENLIENCGKLQGKEVQCQTCIFAKNTRAIHPKLKSIRSKDLLELIHSDVWGPAPTTSKNGYRYILTFLDDYSRRAFCYPMRTKDEVCSKLKNFITFVERQTEKKIKTIRTDNGLEYVNKPIMEMLGKLGIKHETTSTYSPQMNGCAERYNRTLFEGMRAFMQAASLPANLWVEAVMAVNYVRNRILHTTIDDIPFRRWYKKKPSIRHLKRYGCTAYIHQPREKRNKFQPRAKKGIFVGYGLGSSGYRVWYPEEDKIIESKHVTFDESLLGQSSSNVMNHQVASEFDDDLSGTLPMRIDVQPTTSSTPTDEEKLATGQEMDREPTDESEEEETQPESDETATFHRYITTRKKGATKGKRDIYIVAPCSEVLRSNSQLKQYCEDKNIIYDKTLTTFSINNEYEGPILLKKAICAKAPKKPDEALVTELIIPKSPTHAKTLPNADKWIEAMNSEIKTMLDRNVWTPVLAEPNQKVIGTKWVFTVKYDSEGKISTYKARLVALGNNQREGLDFNETYSPVVNFSLIRLFMIIFVSLLSWANCLLDVRCAYLYGDIDREIFIKQPLDYVIPGKENYILKLNKAIYGLHQAGRCWYNDLHQKLITNGFTEVPGLTCVYNYRNMAVVLVYVDDLPIFAKNEEILKEVIECIESLYQVRNLGTITNLLGIQFEPEDDTVKIHCRNYIEKCLKKYNIKNVISLPMQPGLIASAADVPSTEEEKDLMKDLPYRNMLGCLLYISNRCRPDIAFSVASLSQFCENPGAAHWKALIRILMYLASTKEMSIKLTPIKSPLQLTAFTDASWAGDPSDRKSWTGFSIFINSLPVYWRVVKQTTVALSPMEAEYISACEAAKELKYFSACLSQLDKTFNSSGNNLQIQQPILYCDNMAAISFIKNKADNVRNRYIDLKYKFVRHLYEQGTFNVVHVSSRDNLADFLTKALTKEQFVRFRSAYLDT